MDVLADILFQIFGELLFEAFATVLSKILEIFIRNVNVDKKFRKNVKFGLTYVFFNTSDDITRYFHFSK